MSFETCADDWGSANWPPNSDGGFTRRSQMDDPIGPYRTSSISSQNNGTFISNTPRGSDPRWQTSESHDKGLKCAALYNEPRRGYFA